MKREYVMTEQQNQNEDALRDIRSTEGAARPEGVLENGEWPITDEEWQEIHRRMAEDEKARQSEEQASEEESQPDDPRAMVKWLTQLREKRGLSQQTLARQSGQSRSAVSRQECSDDANLSVEEIAAYVRGLGMSCTLKIYDDELPRSLQIRRTVMDLMRLSIRLHRLLRCEGGHEDVVEDINAFIAGAVSPMLMEALESGQLDRDAVFGTLHIELAPGA
jgi:transcriptional regulator with XRE-family HTH domain